MEPNVYSHQLAKTFLTVEIDRNLLQMSDTV